MERKNYFYIFIATNIDWDIMAMAAADSEIIKETLVGFGIMEGLDFAKQVRNLDSPSLESS